MRRFTLAAAAWLLGTGLAGAQPPPSSTPLARGDVQASVAWQNIHQPQSLSSDDWLNALAFGDAAAAFYWTDHLRTQVDLGAGTQGTQYRVDRAVAGSVETFTSSRVGVRERSIAVSQQYQFFRNAWFHPHVGGGVEIASQRRTQEFDPVFAFDARTGQTRQISQTGTAVETHWLTRPFADVGYKAYVSRRAFFVNDLRLAVRQGIDEVQIRVGFGVDF